MIVQTGLLSFSRSDAVADFLPILLLLASVSFTGCGNPEGTVVVLHAGILSPLVQEAFQRFHSALFQAFFTGGKNIMEKETLVAVAREAGLDVSTFMQDLDDPALQQEVKKTCEEAVDSYGISGVPTVIIGGKRRLVGAVPAEDYLKALEVCGLQV